MAFSAQTNTRRGLILVLAAAALTDKEGYLAILGNDSGTPKANLPAALTDIPLYVIRDGGASGAQVAIEPLVPDQQVRLKLKGTADAGDIMVLADPGTAADAGKVRKLPATAGVYVQVGKAEETGTDGQLLLVRPCIKLVYVAAATVAAGGAPGATYAQAEAADVQGKLNAVITALKGAGIIAAA